VLNVCKMSDVSMIASVVAEVLRQMGLRADGRELVAGEDVDVCAEVVASGLVVEAMEEFKDCAEESVAGGSVVVVSGEGDCVEAETGVVGAVGVVKDDVGCGGVVGCGSGGAKVAEVVEAKVVSGGEAVGLDWSAEESSSCEFVGSSGTSSDGEAGGGSRGVGKKRPLVVLPKYPGDGFRVVASGSVGGEGDGGGQKVDKGVAAGDGGGAAVGVGSVDEPLGSPSRVVHYGGVAVQGAGAGAEIGPGSSFFAAHVRNPRVRGLRSWLARVTGMMLPKQAMYDLALASHARGAVPVGFASGQQQLRMIEVVGDAAVSLVMVMRCYGQGEAINTVQDRRSRELSTANMARVCVDSGLAAHAVFSSGVDPATTKSGADVLEAVAGVYMHYCGLNGVEQYVVRLGLCV